MSTRIYTAYAKPDLAEPSDRVVLVREGFAWLALVFGALWLLARGLWVATALYVLLLGLIIYGAQNYGASNASLILLQLFAQLVLGFSGNDLVRESLTRRGYGFARIVVAESPLAAERRYHDAVA